jgi:hypothetical protein
MPLAGRIDARPVGLPYQARSAPVKLFMMLT